MYRAAALYHHQSSLSSVGEIRQIHSIFTAIVSRIGLRVTHYYGTKCNSLDILAKVYFSVVALGYRYSCKLSLFVYSFFVFCFSLLLSFNMVISSNFTPVALCSLPPAQKRRTLATTGSFAVNTSSSYQFFQVLLSWNMSSISYLLDSISYNKLYGN